MNGMIARLILAGPVVLLLCLSLGAPAQGTGATPLLSRASGSKQADVPLSGVFGITSGIVLAFHEWPDEEEKAGILRDAEKAGLQKEEEEFEYAKVWFFTWIDQEPRGIRETHGICQTFSSLSTLRNCRPMYVSRPKEVR